MPIMSATSLVPPNILQRVSAMKKALGPVRISPAFAPQTIPATSLWYEANTLYFVGNSVGFVSPTVPYPVAFGSLAAFASYASSAISGCGAIPASLYPAPYSPQNLPGYGSSQRGLYWCCFVCSPGLVGVCVPAVQAVVPTWLKWLTESQSGISGVYVPSFYMPAGFGPLCPGLPSTVQTLCSSGMANVNIAYVLLGTTPNSNPGWPAAGVLQGA